MRQARTLAVLAVALSMLAAGRARAASIDVAASSLAGAEVLDLSEPGTLAFSLLVPSGSAIELAVVLDPSETASPLGLIASLVSLGDLPLSSLAISTLGAPGVALGTIGSFARDGRASAAAPPAVAGRVTVPLDAKRPLHVLELGATAANGAQPWTIQASGLGAPHRFRLRIEPIPEPGALVASLAAFGAIAALARRRRSRGILLGIGLLAFGTDVARAANVSVTSGIDGAVGSLRERLLNVVQDGDTITFSVAAVGLANPLGVIHQGLTFQGPVTIQPQGAARTAVGFSANQITVQGSVRFLNTTVSAGSEFGTTGFRLLGNRFEGDSALFLEHDVDCEVRDNTFAASPQNSQVIGTSFTENCAIAHNSFDTSADSAINDDESEGLVIDDNTANANITVAAKSGAITNNDVPEIWVFPPGAGADQPLIVSGNDVDLLLVKRSNVEVVSNVVHAGEGFGRLGAAAYFVHGGPPSTGSFSARQNTVTGGQTGILFADLFGPTQSSELRENDVSGAKKLGITARLTAGTVIADNPVHDNGTGTGGTGIEILHARTPGVTENNLVTNTQGAGIEVIEPNQTYTVRGNTITGSSAAGIEMVGGPGRLTIEANTVATNQGPGVAIRDGALAVVTGGSYTDNGDAGILVFPGARSEITQISATGNVGPGIDLFPKAVTPNPATKDANQDLDWPEFVWDPASQQIIGTAAPLSRVEVYVVEGGPRIGNPDNGEGFSYLGFVMTDAAGNFTYPGSGALLCTPQQILTLTDTVPGANAFTSEFSTDFSCDLDEDGIAIGDDRCAATPEGVAVNADGCYETRTQPDGTDVYCNSATSCSASTGNGLGPCIDCGYETLDGAFWDCFGSTTCITSSADGARSCGEGCSIDDGEFSVACGEGGCTATANGLYECSGSANECTGSAGDRSFSCPADLPCEIHTHPGVPNAATSGQVTITKESIGGDDSFQFGLILIPFESPRTGTIPTSSGAGTKLLRVIVPGAALPGATYEIFEFVPNDWVLTNVICDGDVMAVEGGIAFDPAPGLDLHCTFVNERLGGPTRPAGGVTSPDVIVRTRTFGLPPGNRIAIAGANGLVIMDPLTGTIPTAGNATLSFLNGSLYQNLLGALVIEKPTGDGADAIFSYNNTSGGSIRTYVPSIQNFGATQLVFGTYRDAVHLGDDPAQTEAILTTTSAIERFTWTDFGGGQLFPNTAIALNNFSGAGTPVSAFAFPAKTRILAVTAGTPGKLVIGDPAQFFLAVSVVGNVGNDPRRIRCLGSVCAVSNFSSDSLTLATWDGATNVAITATQAVGDGPIGIDLAQDGANVIVASTGFTDSTYTLTTVAPNGSVVSSETLPAPVGCDQPGHALWLDDAEQSLVLSCYGSDALAVITPGIAPP
ncbi:MAG: hypothetical protein H6R20_652 [Proteobacteria bacterium]|nr:hypothetical protein [Pseudomonadota bacterium]